MTTTTPAPAPSATIPSAANHAATGSAVGSLRRMVRHAVSPTVLLNIAAPFASYEVLTRAGLSELTALAVGSVFPLAGIGLAALRRRRLDGIGIASLAGIMVGLLGGLLLHSAEFLLVKDSIITGGIGVVFLASLLAARPLVFVLGRQISGTDPAAIERQWNSDAGFRRSCRQMTTVWGVALLAEAGLRIGLSVLIAPATLLLSRCSPRPCSRPWPCGPCAAAPPASAPSPPPDVPTTTVARSPRPVLASPGRDRLYRQYPVPQSP